MRLSLRYRLLLPLALLLAGDAAATAWAAAAAARGAERRLADQQWAVAATLQNSTFPLTEPILEQVKGLSGAELLFVRPGAEPQCTFPKPHPPPPTDVPTATRPAEAEEHALGPPVTVAGNEYRCLRLHLREPSRNAGGDLYIFYPESLRRTAVRHAVQPLLSLGAAGLLAVVLALAFGSRLVSRVRALGARTRLIAAGDFRPVPPPGANDELRDLGGAVNEMARRLAAFPAEFQRTERLQVLGQFSGGLAHQLRNAAAGARLAVELFLTENPAADPEPLRVALRQLARIEANLRQFLALGKPPDGERKPCDLGELVDQAVSLLRPQCQHAGTALLWEAPRDPVAVTGDPTQLAHLLGNVIGNAVEVAGARGEVVVRLSATHGGARVDVSDTGPGPPPHIAEQLFDPFVTGKEQGIGLGLAVAKQAADAHGGSIAWARKEGRTVFTIQLPRG
ncbi:MAG: sensor histidine kinase [Gemmata sp.]